MEEQRKYSLNMYNRNILLKKLQTSLTEENNSKDIKLKEVEKDLAATRTELEERNTELYQLKKHLVSVTNNSSEEILAPQPPSNHPVSDSEFSHSTRRSSDMSDSGLMSEEQELTHCFSERLVQLENEVRKLSNKVKAKRNYKTKNELKKSQRNKRYKETTEK